MSQTKKWGEEDFWGLGYEWDPQWVLTDKQKELQTKLIELVAHHAARQRRRIRQEAALPAQEFRGPGQARPARPDRAQGAGRHGREPCLRRHGGGDHRALRLRQHRHVLHHAYRRGGGGLLALSQQRDPEEHPAPSRQGCLHRHPLLLRPGDRIAFLVPDLLRRREGRGRLEGAQEGLLDHLRRLRRLVHHPDHQPGFRRQLRRSLLLADHGQ